MVIWTGWESLLPSPDAGLISISSHEHNSPALRRRAKGRNDYARSPENRSFLLKEQLQARLVYYAYYHNGSVGADADIYAAILRLSVLISSDKSFTVSAKGMFDRVQYLRTSLGQPRLYT